MVVRSVETSSAMEGIRTTFKRGAKPSDSGFADSHLHNLML